MVGAPKGRPAPTSAATKPPTSRRLEAPRRLIKKASANVSRKQVFAAHRAVWLEKKKVADEAKRELRQQKAAHVEHLHNKKANKAFDYPTLKAVQEGLTTAIEALGEPITPLSLFMGAFTALAKSPEKHQMAYLLAILSACVPRLSQGVLYHQLEPIFNLCEQLIAENVSTNYLVATKAMKLIQSVLLSMELPTMEALHAFEKLQPNKLNLDSMKLYLGTFRKLLEQSALANASASSAANEDVVAAPHRRDPHTGLYTLNPQQKFFAHAMPHFVRVCVSNFTDATATVAATSAAELSLLFDRALSPYVVESAEGSRMINDLLSNELLSLLKPATQNYWGLALDMLEHLFARLSYVKRVRVATPSSSSSSSSSTAEASIIPFTTRFPSITFFLKVLNKLRSMDDATLNPKVERVMVALGKGMSVADFVEILPFDPQEAYEAELRGEGGARWANSYTLGVIRRLADHDSLPYLVEHFFPSIQFVSRQAVEAERAGRAEELTRWTALQIQYWRIAVGFCHYPTTITDGSFRDVAKQLVGLLSSPSFVDTSATALHVLCDGYHQLATAAEEEEDEDDDVELLEDDMRRPSEKPNSAEVAARHRRDRRDALDEDDLYLSMNDPTWNPHRYHNISQAVAKEGCSIFSKYSANIMPKLCNTFETHDSTAVLLAIQSFSKVCSPAVMTTILTGILTVGANIAASAQAKADGVSGSGDGSSAKAGNQPLTSKRRMILDIACAVVGQLPTEHVMSLFGDVIEPVLMDPAPESRLLQKKAYKLLFALFEHRIQDIFPLFHRVVGLIHVGRRHVTISGVKMRIRCLSWVLDACKLYHPNEMRQTIQSSIAEVILFSRERSSETRAMTMEVLEKMQRYATSAGAPSNYVLHLVIAGLSGKTAQMISSAVVCMAKMVYLTHHELPEKDLNAAVALGFQLMESSMVEVRSAASIFARMTLKLMKRSPSVAKAAKLALPKLLYAIALVTSQPHVSSTIRMQMRVLLEKCIKRFGLAEVDPIFPIGSKNFLRYTHKMMRREEKKAEHQLKKRQEEQKNEFDRLFLGASMHAGREDAAEEDLLQAGALTTFVAKHSAPTFGSTSAMFHRGEDAEDEYDTMHLDFQTDGKLRIVSMEEKHREDDLRRRQALADRLLRKNNGLLNAEAVNAGAIVNTRSGKRARTDETEDFENEELMKRYGNRVSEAAAQKAAAKLNGGRVVGPSAQQITRLRDQKAERMEAKRQRVEEDIRKGDEFQGAGVGDVKRGNIEPYAYVPLNRRYMNRRNARQALHRFEVVSNRHLKGEKAKTAAQQK